MHEKIKAYLDQNEKAFNQQKLIEKTKTLIDAGLYESYLGPHVEELFEPISPNPMISKSDSIQYAIDKSTGVIHALRYDFKEKAFRVYTPLEVDDETYEQIKKYQVPKPKTSMDQVLFIFAILFYTLAFVLVVFTLPSSELMYLVFGVVGLSIGLILHALSVIIHQLNK